MMTKRIKSTKIEPVEEYPPIPPIPPIPATPPAYAILNTSFFLSALDYVEFANIVWTDVLGNCGITVRSLKISMVIII